MSFFDIRDYLNDALDAFEEKDYTQAKSCVEDAMYECTLYSEDEVEELKTDLDEANDLLVDLRDEIKRSLRGEPDDRAIQRLYDKLEHYILVQGLPNMP